MDCTLVDFPDDCFIDQKFPKFQIYLHHTASSADPFGVIDYWKKNKNKVGTPYLIAGKANSKKKWKDGEVFRLFHSNRGIWHLGLSQKHLLVGGPNRKSSKILNLCSVGIEVCNWGSLVLKNGKFYSYPKNYSSVVIPESEVHEYDRPFRGSKYYHKYTDAQLTSLHQLVSELGSMYDIDIKYKGIQIFDIHKDALCGVNGVWTHCSVRPPSDKQDMHPQPELLQMLESL